MIKCNHVHGLVINRQNNISISKINVETALKNWYNQDEVLRVCALLMKKNLAAAAEISTFTITEKGKDENVTTDVLGKVCAALDCSIEDIMEFIPDEIITHNN